MSVLLIRILLFSCVPIGIVVLVKAITMIRRSIYGAVILEIPYLDGSGKFAIQEQGNFSIWHKAPLIKWVPVEKYKPSIYAEQSGEQIPLSYSITGMHANGFYEGRIETFVFEAAPGNYILRLTAGSSITGLQKMAAKIIPVNTNAGLSKHFIQIRKSQPQLLLFLSIPLTILGVGGILGGFVLGLLADQVFK